MTANSGANSGKFMYCKGQITNERPISGGKLIKKQTKKTQMKVSKTRAIVGIEKNLMRLERATLQQGRLG